MDMVERRKYRRYPVYCPIEYRRADDNSIDSSITLNLSEAGALISTRKHITPDTRLVIRIILKGDVFFVRARVVHIEPELDKNVYDVGLEFMQNSFSFIRRFYEELESIMLYQRECSQRSGRQVTLPEASMQWYNSPH